MSKIFIPAIGAAIFAVSFSAQAEIFPDFCVDASAGGALATAGSYSPNCSAVTGTATGFTADYVGGTYAERISLAPTGPGSFLFNSMIVARWSSFSFGDDPLNQVTGTGINNNYNLYAVVEAIGTASGTSFTPTSATFSLYLDNNFGTNLTLSNIVGVDADMNGFVEDYTFNVNDDFLLASGTYASGSGSLAPNSENFALTFKDVVLTDTGLINGENFFIAPRPFYVNVFSDGEISNPTFGSISAGNFTAGGDLSFNFQPVPEPGSLALAGLALVGLGVARKYSSKNA